MTITKLTDKQRLFVKHYLDCLSAGEAAKRAGYSQNTCYSTGGEYLRKPHIRAAVDEGMRDMAMPKDEVIQRLGDHARADMRHFIQTEANGDVKYDVSDSRPLHLIKKITIKDGKVASIELHDSQAALEKLGRLHALFVDRHELTGKDGEPLLVIRTVTAVLHDLSEPADEGDEGDEGEDER